MARGVLTTTGSLSESKDGVEYVDGQITNLFRAQHIIFQNG